MQEKNNLKSVHNRIIMNNTKADNYILNELNKIRNSNETILDFKSITKKETTILLDNIRNSTNKKIKKIITTELEKIYEKKLLKNERKKELYFRKYLLIYKKIILIFKKSLNISNYEISYIYTYYNQIYIYLKVLENNNILNKKTIYILKKIICSLLEEYKNNHIIYTRLLLKCDSLNEELNKVKKEPNIDIDKSDLKQIKTFTKKLKYI